jgi:GntR family transcriptional regulator
MALDFAPPRYAQLVTAIQDRISSGAYAPGSLMPTEAALTAEFGVSRATVVRALQLLKADGWVESHQGRGTYVRAAPTGTETVRRGADLFLTAEPAGRSELLHAGPAVPPPAVAEGTDLESADALAEGTREHLARRKRLSIERVTERITARAPTAEEVRVLAMPRRVPVLDLLVIGHAATGDAVQAVAVTLPADRHELEDTYSL